MEQRIKINAYEETYLEDAMYNIGCMLEGAYNMSLNPIVIWDLFCNSKFTRSIEIGFAKYVAGHSGLEYIDLIECEHHEFEFNKARNYFSKKYNEYQCYWAGSCLAYLQFKTCLSFKVINKYLPIEDVLNMYNPLHEADISKFFDIAIETIKKRKVDTNLKLLRKNCKLTQSELSNLSGVDVSSIQKYEQRVLDINKASAESLFKLSIILHCKIEDLIEKI